MLCELMDGRAFTNKELALAAGVTAQTATAHLKLLQAAGLVLAEKSGRCVYHRIAGAETAALLEQLAALAPSQDLYHRQCRKAGALAGLRSCYDHLAGPLAVRMTEVFLERGMLVADQGSYRSGRPDLWQALGITPAEPKGRGAQARPCLDWTERRHHLAGPLGRQIMDHGLTQAWFHRQTGARELVVTDKGSAVFSCVLGIETKEIMKEGAAHG